MAKTEANVVKSIRIQNTGITTNFFSLSFQLTDCSSNGSDSVSDDDGEEGEIRILVVTPVVNAAVSDSEYRREYWCNSWVSLLHTGGWNLEKLPHLEFISIILRD